MSTIDFSQALKTASDTRQIELAAGAIASCSGVYQQQFGHQPAIVIADTNTFSAAGKSVAERLSCREPFVFTDPDVYAEFRYVEELDALLKNRQGIPVAVGSGVINDLVKLAAHRAGRSYMIVATAASMDGYTAFGSSITYQGSKQTFDGPAPRAVVVDLDVIRKAPPEMNAAGYADLIAKITAGADWIVADALGVEAIDPHAWKLVQAPLRDWLADPSDMSSLMQGLLMSGLAMQATRTSRPASGAEHQFSHLWDMQRQGHDRSTPSHGFQVGVATVAVAELYEKLLSLPLENLDIDHICANWPEWEAVESQIRATFQIDALVKKALEETRAKYISRAELAAQLRTLRQVWPSLKQQLARHLFTSREIRNLLRKAGAPSDPEQIGLSRSQLLASFRQAYYIRRRFTVLDLAARCGVLDQCLSH